MNKLSWRARSVLLLLLALGMFALCIHQAREHRGWAPWCIAGFFFLVLGARKPRNKQR